MKGGQNFTDNGGRNSILNLALFTTVRYPSRPRPHRFSSAFATLRLKKTYAEDSTFERTLNVHF